jgi:hypothetical protein
MADQIKERWMVLGEKAITEPGLKVDLYIPH